MIKKRKKIETVMGWRLAPPRLTLHAFLQGLLYVGLPFLVVMLALDAVFYVFFNEVLDSCYGILCLLD